MDGRECEVSTYNQKATTSTGFAAGLFCPACKPLQKIKCLMTFFFLLMCAVGLVSIVHLDKNRLNANSITTFSSLPNDTTSSLNTPLKLLLLIVTVTPLIQCKTSYTSTLPLVNYTVEIGKSKNLPISSLALFNFWQNHFRRSFCILKFNT